MLFRSGKFGLRALVLRAFRYPWPTAALVSLHLAQTGEFSFVLAQVGRAAGLISPTVYHAILAASLIAGVAGWLLLRRWTATAAARR